MLELGYILLQIFVVAFIIGAYNAVLKKLNHPNRSKKVLIAFGGILVWSIYVFIISKSGVIANFDFPPRFPILLIFPLFIFTGFFLYKHRNSEILHAIPKSWPVYFQSFRILVEILFIYSVAEGILNPIVTFEGYNMDILFGSSALVIGFLVFTKKVLPERVALWWNYLGLTVLASIIFLFFSTIYISSFWGSEVPLANLQQLDFPYTLVPGFLMPLAVFFHFLSIIQLRRKVD